MSMIIDTLTLDSFFASTLMNVAEKLKIQNVVFKSSHELYAEIAVIDGNIYKQLVDFFAVYVAWYNVHESIDKAGTQGQLTPEQNQKLLDACKKRDIARGTFMAAYEKL